MLHFKLNILSHNDSDLNLNDFYCFLTTAIEMLGAIVAIYRFNIKN